MKTFLISLIVAAACVQSAISAEEKGAPAQRVFETPEAAADAFVAALKTGENAPLIEIFGTKHKDLIGYVHSHQRSLFGEDEDEADEDLVSEEMLEDVPLLPRDELNVIY